MGLRELTIIQYQNVSHKHHLNRLWLSVDAFERQIEYLKKNNFRFLSIHDAINYMEKKTRPPVERPISLTFDNGYMDFYENVFPILSRLRIPATLLISPPRVGKHLTLDGNRIDFLTWDRLEELIKAGITIGAFEDNAWNINQIPEDVVQRHIVEYKKRLEDKLGVKVLFFGVKEGVPNNRTRELLISKGYRAFLTECPTNRKADLYSIGRIQVDDDDFNIFLTKISRTYLFFKDRKSWKYIREYSLDKLAHRISEAYDNFRGLRSH